MTFVLRSSLPVFFRFDEEKLTDARLESILKKTDGKLAHLSMQKCIRSGGKPHPEGNVYTYKEDYECSWRSPLTPKAMLLILNASRDKLLNHLDLQGCLQVIFLGFKSIISEPVIRYNMLHVKKRIICKGWNNCIEASALASLNVVPLCSFLFPQKLSFAMVNNETRLMSVLFGIHKCYRFDKMQNAITYLV